MGHSMETGVDLRQAQPELNGWTAQEFRDLVLETKPRIAVFDCDGTLWNGDSGDGFMAWSIEQGLVSRSTADWIDTRYRAYLAGANSETQMCGEAVQMYAGLREQELREAADRYVSEFIKDLLFPEMVALVVELRRDGTELWAASSTNKWVIAAAVRELGIPEAHVLAVDVRVANGLITSELLDVPNGEGKAAALRRAGVVRPDAAFGNSIHDLAMLEMAGKAFPVNPTPALMKEAASRGWGYFRPAGAQSALVNG